MVRQLLKFAIVLLIGVSPIAHEVCQLSCESTAVAEHIPASASEPASPHSHCAAANATGSNHSVNIARAASPCRSASDLQSAATIVIKAVVHPLLPLTAVCFDSPILTRNHRLGADPRRPHAFTSVQSPIRV